MYGVYCTEKTNSFEYMVYTVQKKLTDWNVWCILYRKNQQVGMYCAYCTEKTKRLECMVYTVQKKLTG